jgi:type VI secretion system protein ImpM
MSGSIRHNGKWTFAACGKHPTAADYVALGDNSPWFSAMSRAVASAYTGILARGVSPDDLMPWDFWIALEHRDGIACGRLIPSRDRMNRPYPLLIMGQGSLQGWVGFWERLPLAMESTWDGMVGLANLQGRSLDALIDGLAILPAPDGCGDAQWNAVNKSGHPETEVARCLQMDGVARMDFNGAPEWSRVAASVAGLMKNSVQAQAPPRAMFLHRGSAMTSIRLFFRPVAPSDLVDMWRFNGRDQSHESN